MQSICHLGSSIATGDFNCDRFGDFIAGGQDYIISGAQGRICVGISNGSTGITFTTYSIANNNIASASSPSLFGVSVGASDFNGDECTDFAGGHTTQERQLRSIVLISVYRHRVLVPLAITKPGKCYNNKYKSKR